MDEMMHTSHRKEPKNLSRESSYKINNVHVAVQGRIFRSTRGRIFRVPDIPVHQEPDIPPPRNFCETAQNHQYIVDRVNYFQD
jgi:hypothetical protein